MRRTILSLTGAAIVGVLALGSAQSTAQAREYWHHEIRYDHRDHDRDHGRHDDHGRYHHDHDRR
jgi:Ni/Co efflux regulator RcnB